VFGDPTAPMRILRELEQALDERGFSTLTEAVGRAHYATAHRYLPAAAEAGAG
jgi:dihydroorotate dehydrogenase (NAD+) catalytic subunit